MTVRTWLESSMKKLGLIAPREVANVDDLADCLQVAQSMLRLWASRSLVVFASSKDSKVLTPGTASYTWGVGGNIITPRPSKLLNAFIRDSLNQDYPIALIPEMTYQGISNKTLGGRPDSLFYHPAYPLGVIYLYPVPDAAETLYIDSMQPFTETSSFTALTDVLAFPPSYEEPMIYGLALRIAPEFGKIVPVEVSKIAESSYETITSLNASNQVAVSSLGLPVGMKGGYSIEEG
jgi:hypothetical protein